MSTLTILRTDTVFAKLPIHTLTKAAPIDICIHQSRAQGVQELHWKVSPSTAYGAPQLLAYKLDTLVVNRHLDTLKRPLPSLICLGSLRQICQDLGQSREASTGNLKRAFHQNAGVYITAKLHYRDLEGKQRRLEAGFHRYGVVFTGESLPDGSTADAVYLILHESYRQVLNSAPTRPIDYDYLMDLKPLAQRFYELLSFKMYAALKYQRSQVSMAYRDLCQFAPQHRHTDGSLMSKQMYRVHQPHLESGYLAAVETERILDPQGEPDWLLHYTPGPKAQAEYDAFTRPSRNSKPSAQIQAGTGEPAEAMDDNSESAYVEPMQAETQADPRPTTSDRHGRNTQAETKPGEFAVTTHDTCGHEPDDPFAAESQEDPAPALVQQFYREVHGVSNPTPHPKEIDHARGLLHRHGPSFASFFLRYAQSAIRKERRTVHVFGGLMCYEASALSAYARQLRLLAQHEADRAAGREAARHEQYQRHRAHCIQAYRDEIGPEALSDLKQRVRQRLEAEAPGSPKAAFDAWVQADLQDQLAEEAGVPDFDDWCTREVRP